jgi:RND family efflux transporter MFP subunit
VAGISFLLAACNQSDAPETEQIRPVKVVIAQTRAVSESVVLTGRIVAEEEVNLAFPMDGRLIDRRAMVGTIVEAGEIVARLDPQIAMNTAKAAEADLAAARAVFLQADRVEKREKENYNKGILPRAQYDQIVQQLQTAQAQVEAAQARYNSAQRQVSLTELRTEVAGIVLNKGADPGEVVRAGQVIVQIARLGKKEARFEVPTRLLFIEGVSQSPPIEVALTDNPRIRVTGYIRDIGVQADAVTRAVPVRVTLPDAPDEMRYGATVTGGISISTPAMMEIPSTALTESRGDPAVWVFNTSSEQVQLRPVRVARYNPGTVIISGGLRDGERVVVAGVQSLRPGQRVKLLNTSS